MRQNKQINREGLHGINEKFKQIFRLFNPENDHAIVKVSEFKFINIQHINELLDTNFKAAIIDIDEAISPHHKEILKENIDAVREMVRQGIFIVIYSNGKTDNRLNPLKQAVKEESGIIYIHDTKLAKPHKRGFEEIILEVDRILLKKAVAKNKEYAHLGPKNFLMIGDNFDTDGGCIRAGIPFALITKPIKGGSKLSTILRFPFQIVPRELAKIVSDYHDRKHKRRVLTDKDFLSECQNIENPQ